MQNISNQRRSKITDKPRGNFVLQPGQVLIGFGSKEQLDNLSSLLGELVTSADFEIENKVELKQVLLNLD